MLSFEDVYNKLAKAAKEKRLKDEIEYLQISGHKRDQLDCLLEPNKYAPVIKWEKCSCGAKKDSKCLTACKFGALDVDENGDIKIDTEKCVGCEECERACKKKKFKINKEIIPVLKELSRKSTHVYAIVAPAFVGQFGEEVSVGKIRSALKQIGFKGMIEVALFADILTLREALEFDKNINTKEDFQLTSCCCPIWLAMIKRVYSELVPHIPPTVSPMVACGRVIKKFHPNCKVVFIGPCIAKKAEAREPDVRGAVDYVLTFHEAKKLFDLMDIDLKNCEENEKEHSSKSGRIYAKVGGVSEAVCKTFEKIRNNSKIKIKPKTADGILACREMLNKLQKGQEEGNFFEGMGCEGGCVGGPKAIIDKKAGKTSVENYSKQAFYETPADNPYVLELLHKLGFNKIEELLNDKNLFTRDFKNKKKQTKREV